MYNYDVKRSIKCHVSYHIKYDKHCINIAVDNVVTSEIFYYESRQSLIVISYYQQNCFIDLNFNASHDLNPE